MELASRYRVKAHTGSTVGQVLCALAIPAAFVHPAISGALYAIVAFIWLLPDQRIERMVAAGKSPT